MRIAIHPVAEAGVRAGRILLAERYLSELGFYGRSFQHPDDRRARSIDDLTGFDVVVTDETDHPEHIAEAALDAGISCVLWSDLWQDRDEAARLDRAFAETGSTLLIGASLGPGIASCLAAHEIARTDTPLQLTVAWTVPGRPLRRGEPLPFPKPVGARWGREVFDEDIPRDVPHHTYVAPVPGEWAGAMARMTGVLDDGVARRVVGVADQAAHLEGLALAAGSLAVASGAYGPGLQWPSNAAESYLERALEAGLTLATYTSEQSSRDRT